MWAKDFVIIFSLLSSLQTKFKEWFQDTSSLSTGSDSTRLCAITAGELDSPNYGTIPPWGVWFGIWGCRYCWSFWMNFRLSFFDATLQNSDEKCHLQIRFLVRKTHSLTEGDCVNTNVKNYRWTFTADHENYLHSGARTRHFFPCRRYQAKL